MVTHNGALFAAYNLGIRHARAEYAAHPTACADWCATCVRPIGTTKDCETCQAVRRMRRRREEAS